MKNKINDTNINININNVNISESGIHADTFYRVHRDVFRFDNHNKLNKQFEELKEENNYFDDEIQEYINELDEEDTKDKNIEELIDEYRDEAINSVLDDITYATTYFEPRIFDKEIAKKCGLFPFFYRNKGLLALAGVGFDNSPKLDAYQALTTGWIDPSSKLFKSFNEFEFRVGKELTQEVIKAIQKEATYA
jgi:hypothetical protein